jgi:hypothetical protein
MRARLIVSPHFDSSNDTQFQLLSIPYSIIPYLSFSFFSPTALKKKVLTKATKRQGTADMFFVLFFLFSLPSYFFALWCLQAVYMQFLL